MIATVYCGVTLDLETRFTDENGSPVNPGTVTGQIILPDGTTADLDVDNPEIGFFLARFTPTTNGLHQYRFAGTGDLDSADEGSFIAQTFFPTPVPT